MNQNAHHVWLNFAYERARLLLLEAVELRAFLRAEHMSQKMRWYMDMEMMRSEESREWLERLLEPKTH